jgi:hypothetical protein
MNLEATALAESADDRRIINRDPVYPALANGSHTSRVLRTDSSCGCLSGPVTSAGKDASERIIMCQSAVDSCCIRRHAVAAQTVSKARTHEWPPADHLHVE